MKIKFFVYVNKVEVKKLFLKLNYFINIPSYEIVFDDSNKSKINTNAIIFRNFKKIA